MMVITHQNNGDIEIARVGTGDRIGKESTFYYKVLQALRAAGEPALIRQVPSKDGHLTGAPYYLVTRKREGGYCYFDQQYALRLAHQDYNRGGVVRLTRHRL